MPVYEFRCATCHTVFDERRPMADADSPATCPGGHHGGQRLLPVFATTGRAIKPMGAPTNGGLCGAPVAGGCGAGCACC